MEERTKQLSIPLGSGQCGADSLAQIVSVVKEEISQTAAVLAVAPDILNRVELGGIEREQLNFQSPDRSAMNHPQVPHQDDSLGKLPEQVGHKGLRQVGVNVAVVDGKEQIRPLAFAREGQGRNDRKPVSPSPAVQHRRLPLRCPRSANGRLEQEAAFVHENDGFTALMRLFLYAATSRAAMFPRPLGRLRGSVFRVFDSSIPLSEAGSSRPRDCRLRQSAGGSVGRSAGEYIARWHGRACGALEAEVGADATSGGRSIWAWGRGAVATSGPSGRLADGQLSTWRPPRVKRPVAWLCSLLNSPVLPVRRHETAAAGVLVLFLLFSWKAIRDIGFFVLSLLKGQ